MVFCQSESESNDDVQLLDLDGGTKPQDLESFIDKDDGGEYYCSRTLRLRKMQRRTQVFIDADIFRRSSNDVISLEALRALCGNP